MDGNRMPELDPADMQSRLPYLNLDFKKLVAVCEEEFQRIRLQQQSGYKHGMRSELKRLNTFLSFQPVSSWSPQEMAGAGFYNTGVASSVQCFCCGLVLCSTSLRISPRSDHLKRQPDCDFIQGKEVGNISKYDVRVQVPPEVPGPSVERFRAEEERLHSFKGWPFYARTDPAALASAGFFFTDFKDTVQCFSCVGCLGNWEEDDDPWKEHAKWFPECTFLQTEKSKDEIAQYIGSYSGFAGVTGKLFFSSPFKKSLPKDTEGSVISNIFEEELVRLESFKTWPEEAHADAAALSKAGFFYTGMTDTVQCFSCGLTVSMFEPEDDPWTEHVKYNSSCMYYSKKLEKESDILRESQISFLPMQDSQTETGISDKEVLSAMMLPESITSFENCQGQEKETDIFEQLTTAYNAIEFRKMPSFGDSTHAAIDLKSLYGDIVIVSKDSRNQPLKKYMFPEVLPELDSITIIQGEAGSGKTALLRRIAILWASGSCPVLNRFRLVFYLSLRSSEREQGLSDMINQQLLKSTGALTEVSLTEIIQCLKSQVLFLIDDYGAKDLVPQIIDTLIHKNHINKMGLVVAVHDDMGGRVRKFAKTVLSITEFPVYSAIYMLKNLFSHNIPLVERFVVQLALTVDFPESLKTPLFALGLCVFCIQYPADSTSDSAICKADLLFNTLKFPNESEKAKAVLSTCGDLALRGLFNSRFEFSDKDLSDSGVNAGEALRYGLLSRCSAQRLYPVYTFCMPVFQEFLAGKRLGELLGSEEQADVEKGNQYLQQINTFLKVMGRYHYLLKYANGNSSKATPKILTHLFNLLDRKTSYDCCSGSNEYLKHHPDLKMVEQNIILKIRACSTEEQHSYFTNMLLHFAVEAAYQSKSMHMCASVILQFIKGKSLSLEQTMIDHDPVLSFLEAYPESLSLLNSLEICIAGPNQNAKFNLSSVGDFCSALGVPTVDHEYSSAFQDVNNAMEKVKNALDQMSSYLTLSPGHSTIPSSFTSTRFAAQSNYKVPLLRVCTNNAFEFPDKDLRNLEIMFFLSEHIDLQLNNSSGFIESIRSTIEQYVHLFAKCRFYDMELSEAEQELILLMSSMESLDIHTLKNGQYPELLVAHLDKYKNLKALSLNVHENKKVMDTIPDDFRNLKNMQSLKLSYINLVGSAHKLAAFIMNFQNLQVFHLKNCAACPEFGAVMTAISHCKKLREIQLIGIDFNVFSFVHILSTFQELKVLNLDSLRFTDKETSEMFATALVTLVHLEELILPDGAGILETATSIIQCFQHLKNLRVLSFSNTSLDDQSLLELARAAQDGFLPKIQKLDLLGIHDITEPGWNNFFLTLDSMPDLKHLNVSRVYTDQIKCHATTVKSCVQCIARLPSLATIIMYGWLFDAEDVKMFNAMKEQHPQSSILSIYREWQLPITPIVQQ
ncbi:baculoviral IAP repeat-containing protein 1-like [Lissotriton helveticus]